MYISRFVKSLSLLGLLFAGSVSAVPVIEHWETSNGAKVLFVAAPELPMVDVRVVFDAGSDRDQGKPGLAVLTNGMLSEGAGDLDADAIARRLEGLGAQLSNNAGREMSTFGLRSLVDPKYLKPASETLALILAKPSFPKEAFERERGRMLVALRSEAESPSDIAEKAFWRTVYANHPYATPENGTEQGLKSIKRGDLQAFYRKYYTGRNGLVAIVGDLDRKAAEALAERLVGALPAGVRAEAIPEVPDLRKAERVAITYPSSQTHILVGQPGVARGDPDYFPLYVGNHSLGGSGLVSRINDEVREKRGLAYSAYSYFYPMGRRGPFLLGLQTANQSSKEALSVLDDTLKRYVSEGPTAKELDDSKKNITGGFPLRIDSNADIVQYLAMIGFYGLPFDYLDTFNAKVEAVTAEQVREAFRRRIHPESMVTVTVGAAQ